MALQMLGVQVSFRAVRARKLAVGILDGNDGALRATSGGSGGASGSTGQNASAALGTNDVGRLITLGQDRVGLHHRASIGRRDVALRHDATRRHGAQDGRATATDGSGSDGLGVSAGTRGLRHHTSRSAIRLGRVGVLGHGVDATTTTSLGRLRVARRKVVRRVGSVGSSRSARSMRVATVDSLHGGGGGLQRRQTLGKRRSWMQLLRGKGSRRRIGVRS